jgi:hypothetical protein
MAHVVQGPTYGANHGADFCRTLRTVYYHVSVPPYEFLQEALTEEERGVLDAATDYHVVEDMLEKKLRPLDDVVRTYATPSTALDRAVRLPVRRGFDEASEAMHLDPNDRERVAPDAYNSASDAEEEEEKEVEDSMDMSAYDSS